MRHLPALLALSGAVLVGPPAAAGPAPLPPCQTPQGVATFTHAGGTRAFQGPAASYPYTLSSDADDSPVGQALLAASQTVLRYQLDLSSAPLVGADRARSSDVAVDLSWTSPAPADLDMYITDQDGQTLVESTSSNALPGETAEEHAALSALPHCAQIVVTVQNWVGAPHAAMTLGLASTRLSG